MYNPLAATRELLDAVAALERETGEPVRGRGVPRPTARFLMRAAEGCGEAHLLEVL